MNIPAYMLVLLMSGHPTHMDRDSGGTAALWLPFADKQNCEAARDHMLDKKLTRLATCIASGA